jgi:integrase
MTVRRKNGNWFYRRWVKMPDGTKHRLYGTPRRYNLPNTKAGATEAEQRALTELNENGSARSMPLVKFAPTFIEHSKGKNKPRTVNSKEQILRDHIVPQLGERSLATFTYAVVEDFKHYLVRPEPDGPGLKAKTANNVLTVLRRLLVVAAKRHLLPAVPEFEWLETEDTEFDFLSFEEADRLLKGADTGSEWTTMILVGLKVGLRQGEILALRWEDVDLKAKRITVKRQVSRGAITKPKGGRSREVDLGDVITAALTKHRHLRGELVFCDADGKMLTAGECKWPLYRACKRAALRRIGWHVLRHTFASHLVMRGVQLKAIQELLGHATIQMTMRYAHLGPETKRDAVKALDQAAQ